MLKKLPFLLLGVFFLLFPTTLAANHKIDSVEKTLLESDVANIVQPAVVGIIHRIKGKVVIPDGRVDFSKLQILPGSGSPLEEEIDEYVYGTGFFINNEGYIVTNTHVVSPEFIRNRLVKTIVNIGFMQFAQALPLLSQEEFDRFSNYSEEEIKAFLDKVYEYIIDNGSFDVESTISVVGPETKGEDIKEVARAGVKAEVIYTNEKVFTEEGNYDDIAIIRVPGKYNVALKLSQNDTIATGEKVYVVGFPSNAQLESGDFAESTFTSGLIGGKKKMGNGEVWQVDTKVSPGSSGGPLLNKDGEVVGVVSFQKDDAYGDPFAFAIQLPVLRRVLSEMDIKNEEGVYASLVREGIMLKRQKHCRTAIEKFQAAKKEIDFVDSDKFIGSYIKECNALIASGASIDTKWDELVEWLSGVDVAVWIVVAVVIVLVIILTAVVMVFRRRIREEEEEIEKLENIVIRDHRRTELENEAILTQDQSHTTNDKGSHRTSANPVTDVHITEENVHRGISDSDTRVATDEQGDTFATGRKQKAAPKVAQEGVSPELLAYVHQARAAGITDDVIYGELKKVGWQDDDIVRVLK